MLAAVTLVLLSALPEGAAPPALPLPHFPDRLHAFVWRNWPLVSIDRMAAAVNVHPDEIWTAAQAMGLGDPPVIAPEQSLRSYISVIRRNWHLLPYDQLLTLLGWTEDQLAFTLREDDFLYVKLGNLKPKCEPLVFTPPARASIARAERIAGEIRAQFQPSTGGESLFAFVDALSTAPPNAARARADGALSPRYCYSYFALYGDPLLTPEVDPYPDGYLARLAASGVDGIWLQGVLFKLASFPWDPAQSEGREVRLESLRQLVARAKRHGMGVYLYLNEPRSMPTPFFEGRNHLRGVLEGEFAALCTSVPEVREYIVSAVSSICSAVPELAGFFTITASENLTSCWSHGQGAACERCAPRGAADVIADVNAAIREGITRAGTPTRLIAWDWGWADAWAAQAIAALPPDTGFMSVSEWNIPIKRGGIESVTGEYALSAIGPGPRAQRHWSIAQERGLTTFAKIQAGTTWELGAVPYIPVVANVAEHVAGIRAAGVRGLMMSWTVGGYPSPNLEVATEIGTDAAITPAEAMHRVAVRRFGEAAAPDVVRFWASLSTVFQEFPFNIGTVYSAPLYAGPANLLWPEPTNYKATMVGFAYDDVETWRSVYPAEVFASQLEIVADGFDAAIAALRSSVGEIAPELSRELGIAEACAIHFRSVTHQTRFVQARNALAGVSAPDTAKPILDELERIILAERSLAVRLHTLQRGDSRIGFEATNHYFYIPADLEEKVLHCGYLLEAWLPAQRARFAPSQ